jgi:hypothetical protein
MEGSPEFAETNSCKAAGCVWELYQNSKAKFVPSIVAYGQYPATTEYFSSNYNIKTAGFIEWAQHLTNVGEESPFLGAPKSVPGLIQN